jgi:hypothetical protein
VHVATATAAGVEGETELTGEDEVREVGNLQLTRKGNVHLRIVLPAAAVAAAGGGGGGGGLIGALLLRRRR